MDSKLYNLLYKALPDQSQPTVPVSSSISPSLEILLSYLFPKIKHASCLCCLQKVFHWK